MFDTRFNDNFQNPGYDPLQENQAAYGPVMDIAPPMPYANAMPSQNPLANAMLQLPAPNYAKGGKVKNTNKRSKSKKPEVPNIFPSLAEAIRQQGGEEDVVLAHINPVEAEMLSVLSGGGRINPITGIPQYGLFNKPGKWFKSVVGGGAGAVLGNIIAPGIGGVIGGALGQGLNNSVRGKNFGQGALKGGLFGAALPSVAGFAGSGLNALGMNGAGSYLSNYGAQNAIMPSLGLENSYGTTGVSAGELGANGASPFSQNLGNGAPRAMPQSFTDSLLGNTKDFLSKPKNLLGLASVAGSLASRPKKEKEKSPEDKARDAKRYAKASILTPQERAELEADLLAEEQMKRRIARNKFLPEERLGNIDPLYVRTNTPDEYKKRGRWLEYYNNPQYNGEPIFLKSGGEASYPEFYEEEIITPQGKGFFLEGIGGGQDDDRRRALRDGSYIIDASTLANMGDGNNRAGARKIDALVSDGEYEVSPEGVMRVGGGNHGRGIKKLDQLVKNIRKHKGGSIKLPPKAKPLEHYMTR